MPCERGKQVVMDKTICHRGVVSAIRGEHIQITIVQNAACGDCRARDLCHSAESKERQIDIYTPNPQAYSIGQEVTLEGRHADAHLAATIAYGLPLALLVVALVVALQLHCSEAVASLVALGTVAAYYAFVAMFMRGYLQRRLSFSIKENKINQ